MLLQVCAYMITVLTYIDNTALFIIMHYLLLYIFFCVCCSMYMLKLPY